MIIRYFVLYKSIQNKNMNSARDNNNYIENIRRRKNILFSFLHFLLRKLNHFYYLGTYCYLFYY